MIILLFPFGVTVTLPGDIFTLLNSLGSIYFKSINSSSIADVNSPSADVKCKILPCFSDMLSFENFILNSKWEYSLYQGKTIPGEQC